MLIFVNTCIGYYSYFSPLKELLSIFRNRLLDLSASNRSVYLPKSYKGKFSDLMTWDFLSTLSGLDMVKQMLAGKASLKIADVQHIKGDDLEFVLEEAKRIIRTKTLIEEETGSADFYVGWPFVEGVFKNGMPLRAPLIFLPYTLKINGREVFLEKRTDVEPHWNRSLFLSLTLHEEYNFDKEWLESPISDLEDTSDKDFRIALIEQLKSQGWSPAFERDFLSTNLTYFLSSTKEDLNVKYIPGQYHLRPYAVMGLYPQSASYIHSDYAELKQRFSNETLDHVFSQQFSAVENNSSLGNTQFSPLPIDGSQENIIAEVVSGKSMVVQGPPGSGKTQLICNLIAQFIGKGKKVLVVCQKKAALDVVYSRLENLELASFISLVHDAVGDRKEVYDKLARQIVSANEYKEQNIHPDTIVLEKEFSRIQSSIARLVDYFSKYKAALYDISVGGETAHALYLMSDRTVNVIDLSSEYRAIPANELESKSGDLEQYYFYTAALQADIHREKEFSREFNIGGDDKELLLDLLNKVPLVHDAIKSKAKEQEYLAFIPLSYANDWSEKVEAWKSTSLIFKLNINYKDLFFSEAQVTDWENLIRKSFDTLSKNYSVPREEEVEHWLQEINAMVGSSWKTLLFRLTGNFTGKALYRWIKLQELSINAQGLTNVREKLNAIRTLYAIRKEWAKLSCINAAATFTSDSYTEQLTVCKALLKERNELFEIPALARIWESSTDFKAVLSNLELAVVERNNLLRSYYTTFSEKTVEHIFKDEKYRIEWINFVTTKFDFYLGYTLLKRNIDALVWRSFEKVLESNRSTGKVELVNVWKESILRCWLNEKERLAPTLKTVSTPEWNLKELELQNLIARRYSISLEFLKIKLKEWVYADIQYNRLNRQVTYRDLKHQVTKKRSVWSLCKTIV
jgi:DNA polymerase IIIc chi subunit